MRLIGGHVPSAHADGGDISYGLTAGGDHW